MRYVSLNGNCHDGHEGIHLQSLTCPEGCFNLCEEDFIANNKQDTQEVVDYKIAEAGEWGLQVKIESVNPPKYTRIYG